MIKSKNNKTVVFLGDGLTKYKDYFTTIPGKEIIFITGAVISGSVICDIAASQEFSDADFNPDRIEPVYLRKSEAENRQAR